MKNTLVATGLLVTALTSSAHAKDIYISALAGAPHPVNFAADYRFGPKLSAGVGGGSFSLTLDQATASMSNFEGRLRWHPFGGAMILGTILGYQKVSATGREAFEISPGVEVPTTIELSLNGMFFTPHFGWMWTYDSGFLWGIELGVQVPLGAKSQLTLTADNASQASQLGQVQSTAEYKAKEKDITDKAEQFGKNPFPYLTVLRLGWAF